MFKVKVEKQEYSLRFVVVPESNHFWGTGTVCMWAKRLSDGAKIHTIAYCSKSDRFDNERGQKEALKKFMKIMGWTREQRAGVWKVYFRWLWEEYEKMLNGLRQIAEAAMG